MKNLNGLIAHFFDMAPCYMQAIVVSIAIICICRLCKVEIVYYVKLGRRYKARLNNKLRLYLGLFFCPCLIVIFIYQPLDLFASSLHSTENVAVSSTSTPAQKPGLAHVSGIRISLDAIAQIESSGNPRAINRKDNGGRGSYGLYQLSPYVVGDFNKAHKSSYKAQIHALEPITAHLIADWYLHKKIPAYLKHFKKPVTLENVLTAYNMGIGAVVKGRVATAYIAKYRRLARVH